MPMRRFSLVVSFLLVVAFTTGRADAQTKEWSVIGTGRADCLGRSLTFTPDADGDGVPDFLVGAPNDYVYASLDTAGRALLYSGATYGLIRVFDGDAPKDSFGSIVASLGDVDGDGVPDFAIAAPHRQIAGLPNGAVFVYSGTGPLIRSFTSVAPTGTVGEAMAAVGDLDGDGVRDLLYSDLNAGARTIFVVSGASGATILSVRDTATNFGFVVGRTGDTDADGVEDFAVGDEDSGGHVRVFSGSTAAQLFTYAADEAIVKPAGDVDRDGHADLIMTRVGNQKVPVVSGATGSAIYTFTGNAYLGYDVSPTGDFDGDGIPDLVVVLGKTRANPDDLFLYSGANGAGLNRYDLGGILKVDGTADLDGDGVSDFIGGNESYTVGNALAGPQGSVAVASGATGTSSKIVGTSFLSSLGTSLTLVNDRDGDGWRDVAIAVSGGLDDHGPVVQIVSGFDGHELSRFAPSSGVSGSARGIVFTGDVDGDGIDDLAVAGAKNAVEIHSGRDDSLIETIQPAGAQFVGDIAAATEVGGAPLLAVTAHTGSASGFVVYDLSTGNVVTTMAGDFYTDIACVGDVDGDGFVDWLVRDWTTHSASVITGGPTPTTLWSYTGAPDIVSGVATSGDLDGDGTDDVLVTMASRHVDALSGRTGNLIFQTTGAATGQEWGFALSSLGDVNGDGVCDFAVGEPYDPLAGTTEGAVDLYSGATAKRLTRMEGETSEQYLGLAFAHRRWHDDGRVDPDPIPDLVCGSYYADAERGRADEYRLPSLFLWIDPSAATAGQTVGLYTRGGPGGAPAGLFAVAFDGAPLNLFVAFGTLGPLGNWSISPTIPSGLAGHTLTLRSYAIGFAGKVVASSDETLTFE